MLVQIGAGQEQVQQVPADGQEQGADIPAVQPVVWSSAAKKAAKRTEVRKAKATVEAWLASSEHRDVPQDVLEALRVLVVPKRVNVPGGQGKDWFAVMFGNDPKPGARCPAGGEIATVHLKGFADCRKLFKKWREQGRALVRFDFDTKEYVLAEYPLGVREAL